MRQRQGKCWAFSNRSFMKSSYSTMASLWMFQLSRFWKHSELKSSWASFKYKPGNLDKSIKTTSKSSRPTPCARSTSSLSSSTSAISKRGSQARKASSCWLTKEQPKSCHICSKLSNSPSQKRKCQKTWRKCILNAKMNSMNSSGSSIGPFNLLTSSKEYAHHQLLLRLRVSWPIINQVRLSDSRISSMPPLENSKRHKKAKSSQMLSTTFTPFQEDA